MMILFYARNDNIPPCDLEALERLLAGRDLYYFIERVSDGMWMAMSGGWTRDPHAAMSWSTVRDGEHAEAYAKIYLGIIEKMWLEDQCKVTEHIFG